MLRYKMDIVKELKTAGYSTYTLRKDKLISDTSLTKIRNNKMVGVSTLEKVCGLLNVDIGDVVEFVKD